MRKFDQNKYAVRSEDYKLLIPFRNGKSLFYNLNIDIGEENDIAGQHPDTPQRLEALRVQWDSELVEPRFLGLIHRARRKKELFSNDIDRDGVVTREELYASIK